MRTVYPDLSGDAELYRDAFPGERDAIRSAIAGVSAWTDYRDESVYPVGMVYCWRLEDDVFRTVVRVWQERIESVVSKVSGALILLGHHWCLAIEAGVEKTGLGLPHVVIRKVLDETSALGTVLLVETVPEGKPLVVKLCNKIDTLRFGTNEAIYSDRARELYAKAAEQSSKLSEISRAKLSLLLESDGPKASDLLAWSEVQGEIEPVAVLTNRLPKGLGYPGTGRALYHVTGRDGQPRLVVEQISSYAEGYTVKYDWIEDVGGL